MSAALLEAVFRETICRLAPAAVTAKAIAAAKLDGPLTLVAAGKAAAAMAHGAYQVLGDSIVNGCIVVPVAPIESLPVPVYVATHPVASAASQRAGEALLTAVATANQVVALISGGASALACVPAAGVSLSDKIAVTSAVMAAGAAIADLNIVRKHLSAIKGGQLAAAAAGPVTTFALSDVVGDRLTDIASGLTVADPSTRHDALRIIKQYAPAHVSVAAHLIETPEHARVGDTASVVAGTGALIEHAGRVAKGQGLHVQNAVHGVTGDVHLVATQLAAIIRPGLIVAGGEPTISLPASPGTGGRAQHLALLLAREIQGQANTWALVAGSDGIDGNTAAAGAIVDGGTWARVENPEAALAAADAGRALSDIGATVVTGATGVNHADLILLLKEG